MSGLVSGLQNRARRFDSARNLETAHVAFAMRAVFLLFPNFYFLIAETQQYLPMRHYG